MFAKAISEISPTGPLAAQPHWARKVLTMIAFFASFSALALLVHERYSARWMPSAYAVVKVKSEASAVSKLPPTLPAINPDAARHLALAEFLAKRYKVSPDITLDLVEIAHAEARVSGLDPLLVMAVIAVESRYNPIAESGVGAKGLMQIIPKYHADKLAEFGGEQAVFDPESNIRVGTRILKEYLSRTGNLSIALQMYAGALGDENDRYTNKVLGEKQRLRRVVASPAEPVLRASRVARRTELPLGG